MNSSADTFFWMTNSLLNRIKISLISYFKSAWGTHQKWASEKLEMTNLRRRPPLGDPSPTLGGAAAGLLATGAATASTAVLAASWGSAATGPINSAKSASLGDCGMTRPLPRRRLPGERRALWISGDKMWRNQSMKCLPWLHNVTLNYWHQVQCC